MSGLDSAPPEPESGETLLSPPAAGSASAARPARSRWLQESPAPAAALLSSGKASRFGAELAPTQQDNEAITKSSFGIKLSIHYISALR